MKRYAKTALWIAESQMLEETKSIVYGFNDDFLPLKTYVNITEGNAADLAFKLHTQADFDSTNKEGTPVSYGNPEIIPDAGKEVVYFSIMSLNSGSTSVKIANVTFSLSEDVSDEQVAFAVEENEEYGENVIINGNFDTDDFSAWAVFSSACS